MPVDFSILETDGLWLHIKLNTLLSDYGFFDKLTPEQKLQFDKDFAALAGQVLAYDEDKSVGACKDCRRAFPDLWKERTAR